MWPQKMIVPLVGPCVRFSNDESAIVFSVEHIVLQDDVLVLPKKEGVVDRNRQILWENLLKGV